MSRPEAPYPRALPRLLPLLTLLSACAAGAADSPPPPEPLPVQTLEVVPTDGYQVQRAYTGVVRARRDTALAFERGGLVAKVLVDEGDVVQRGQLVARLDTSQLRAARRRLIASLEQARAGVGISELTSARLSSLAEDQFASRQASDEARFGLQKARAQRDEIQAAIAQIDVDLRKSRLLAPYRGTVASRSAEEGSVVAAGVPVVRFQEQGGLEALVGVPESVAPELPPGSEHTLRIGAREVRARVSAQVDRVERRTRTLGVIFALPDDDPATDGQVARLLHQRTIAEPGAWLPLSALTRGLRGLFTVYAVGADQRLQREEVELLHATEQRAFVRGTLAPGAQVVASGLHRVVPGQRVRDLGPAASTTAQTTAEVTP